MQLKEINYITFINETLKLDNWYLNGLAETTSKQLFYKQDPNYLYTVAIDKYHTKYKKENIYYIYLINAITSKKRFYKTSSEKKALQLADDFYMQARLDLNFR